MARKKLTSRFVESLKVDTRTDFWDEVVKGLALRASPTGSKSWSVIYTRDSDGKKRRATLGPFPAISLKKARRKALETLTRVVDGEDPAGSSADLKASMTVRDLSKLYIEKHAMRYKRTWREDERVLTTAVLPAVGDMKLSKVSKRDIVKILDEKADNGKLRQADVTLSIIRKMFNWAVDKAHIEMSPVTGLKPSGPMTKRERFLSGHEIKEVWEALPTAGLSPSMQDIIRLLLLTGQRSGEVAGLTRQEINLDSSIWVLPAERTKNKRSHAVPIVGMTHKIIENAEKLACEYEQSALFAKINKPIESNAVSQSVRKKLQLFDEKWTPHDLRRTVASGMAEIGILPHVIEAALNHVSGFRSGVAGVYNRHHYTDEIRNAFDRWDNHILGIVNQSRNNVLPLERLRTDE